LNYDEDNDNVNRTLDSVQKMLETPGVDWPIVMRQNEVHFAQDRYNGEISRIVEDAKRRKVITI
jgi:hypothetical protein